MGNSCRYFTEDEKKLLNEVASELKLSPLQKVKLKASLEIWTDVFGNYELPTKQEFKIWHDIRQRDIKQSEERDAKLARAKEIQNQVTKFVSSYSSDAVDVATSRMFDMIVEESARLGHQILFEKLAKVDRARLVRDLYNRLAASEKDVDKFLFNNFDTVVELASRRLKKATGQTIGNLADSIDAIRDSIIKEYPRPKGPGINIAPYYFTPATVGNTSELVANAEHQFMVAAANIADLLNLKINNTHFGLGGYYSSNIGQQVREISYRIDVKGDLDVLGLYASLLGDLGYQGQEAVIASHYVKTEEEASAYEIFIECDTTDKHNVAKILEEAGYQDYTITNGGVQLQTYTFDYEDMKLPPIDEVSEKYTEIASALNAKGKPDIAYIATRYIESSNIDKYAKPEEARGYELFIKCNTKNKQNIKDILEGFGYKEGDKKGDEEDDGDKIYTIVNGGVQLRTYDSAYKDGKLPQIDELAEIHKEIISALGSQKEPTVKHIKYLKNDREPFYNEILKELDYVEQVPKGSTGNAESERIHHWRSLSGKQRYRLRNAIEEAKTNLGKFLRTPKESRGVTLKPLNESLGDWVDTEKYLEVLDNARRADEDDNDSSPSLVPENKLDETGSEVPKSIREESLTKSISKRVNSILYSLHIDQEKYVREHPFELIPSFAGLTQKLQEYSISTVGQNDSLYQQMKSYLGKDIMPEELSTLGNRSLLNETGIAVVGKSNSQRLATSWAMRMARNVALSGNVLISSGTKIESVAVDATLAAGGRAIVVIPTGLNQSGLQSRYKTYIQQGRVLLISGSSKNDRWTRNNAFNSSLMANALSSYILVADSDSYDSGTYGRLRNASENSIPLYTRQGMIGEKKIKELGAKTYYPKATAGFIDTNANKEIGRLANYDEVVNTLAEKLQDATSQEDFWERVQQLAMEQGNYWGKELLQRLENDPMAKNGFFKTFYRTKNRTNVLTRNSASEEDFTKRYIALEEHLKRTLNLSKVDQLKENDYIIDTYKFFNEQRNKLISIEKKYKKRAELEAFRASNVKPYLEDLAAFLSDVLSACGLVYTVTLNDLCLQGTIKLTMEADRALEAVGTLLNLDQEEATKERTKPKSILYFYGHTPDNDKITSSCLSQMYECSFSPDGFMYYNSMEQYMHAQKADLFGDKETFKKIMNAESPEECKRLGRQVRGFSQEIWDQNKYNIIVEGNLAKFSDNPKLKEYLLSTGDAILAEASPSDKIWGIGMSKDAAAGKTEEQWQGQNLLGKALMEVRARLSGKEGTQKEQKAESPKDKEKTIYKAISHLRYKIPNTKRGGNTSIIINGKRKSAQNPQGYVENILLNFNNSNSREHIKEYIEQNYLGFDNFGMLTPKKNQYWFNTVLDEIMNGNNNGFAFTELTLTYDQNTDEGHEDVNNPLVDPENAFRNYKQYRKALYEAFTKATQGHHYVAIPALGHSGRILMVDTRVRTREEIIDGLKRTIMGELHRIDGVLKRKIMKKKIAHYDGNILYTLMPELNYIEEADPVKLLNATQKTRKDWIAKLAEAYVDRIICNEEEINELREVKGEHDTDEDIRRFLMNDTFMRIQMTQILGLDPAFYSQGDYNKRIHGAQSNVYRPNVSSNEKMRIAVFKDIVRDSKYLTEIEAVLRKNKKLSEAEIQKALSSFKKMTVTDGQSFMTLSAYRKYLDSLGDWSPEQERVYQAIKKGEINSLSAESFKDASFTPIKPLGFGQYNKQIPTEDSKTLRVRIPYYLKTSISPIISLGDGTHFAGTVEDSVLLSALNEWMENNNIDIVTFSSAMKIGAYNTGSLDEVYNSQNIEDGRKELEENFGSNLEQGDESNTIMEVPYWTIGKQMEIPDHSSDTAISAGTQRTKLAFVNMSPDTMLHIAPGIDMTVAQAQELYSYAYLCKVCKKGMNTYSKFTNRGIVDMLNTAKEASNAAIVNDSFDLNEKGELEVPLYMQPNFGLVTKTLLSTLKNGIVKDKVGGAALVQASSFASSEHLKIEFDYDKDGKPVSVKYLECRLPAYMRVLFNEALSAEENGGYSLDANKIPEDLRYALGFRIPTENLGSMKKIYIKEFLHPVFGSRIELPLEIVAIDGSDFDADKQYLATRFAQMFRDIKKRNARKLKAKEYDFNKDASEQSIDAIDALLIQITNAVLSSPEGSALNLEGAGGIGDLKEAKKIVQEILGEKKPEKTKLAYLTDENAYHIHNDNVLGIKKNGEHFTRIPLGQDLIGIYAIANAFIPYLQQVKAHLKEKIVFPGRTGQKEIVLDKFGEGNSEKYVQQKCAGSTDFEKDDALAYVNANKEQATVGRVLSALGMKPQEEIFIFNNPFIKTIQSLFSGGNAPMSYAKFSKRLIKSQEKAGLKIASYSKAEIAQPYTMSLEEIFQSTNKALENHLIAGKEGRNIMKMAFEFAKLLNVSQEFNEVLLNLARFDNTKNPVGQTLGEYLYKLFKIEDLTRTPEDIQLIANIDPFSDRKATSQIEKEIKPTATMQDPYQAELCYQLFINGNSAMRQRLPQISSAVQNALFYNDNSIWNTVGRWQNKTHSNGSSKDIWKSSLSASAINSLVNEISDYVLQNNNDFMQYTTIDGNTYHGAEALRKMLAEMPDRLNDIRTRTGNRFLNNLYVSEGLIKATNQIDNADEYINVMNAGWLELFNSTDEEVRAFAKDLFKYSALVYGQRNILGSPMKYAGSKVINNVPEYKTAMQAMESITNLDNFITRWQYLHADKKLCYTLEYLENNSFDMMASKDNSAVKLTKNDKFRISTQEIKSPSAQAPKIIGIPTMVGNMYYYLTEQNGNLCTYKYFTRLSRVIPDYMSESNDDVSDFIKELTDANEAKKAQEAQENLGGFNPDAAGWDMDYGWDGGDNNSWDDNNDWDDGDQPDPDPKKPGPTSGGSDNTSLGRNKKDGKNIRDDNGDKLC